MFRLVAGLVLLLPAGAWAEQFEVEVRLWEGDPRGSREAGTLKLLAAPTVVMNSDEGATLLVGGHVPISGRLVPVGREVEMTASRTDDGSIRVRAVLRHHATTGGPAPQVTTASERTVATVAPGGTVRVELGSDPKNRQWAELRVRPTN